MWDIPPGSGLHGVRKVCATLEVYDRRDELCEGMGAAGNKKSIVDGYETALEILFYFFSLN